MSDLNDDAGENWVLVQMYSPDLAKRIEKRFRTSDDKTTKKACVAFIRECGYGNGKIAHGTGKHGSGMQPKTKVALQDISQKLAVQGF